MNLKLFFKSAVLPVLAAIVFSFSAAADAAELNSLFQISAEKPIDNSYQLNLFFEDKFNGNAFVQKIKNGVFHVFIPDTTAASRNIKVLYQGKVKPSDVKITINELPYNTKEDSQSKCVKLTVQTPINSDIQLTAQKYIPQEDNNLKIGGSLMSILTIIAAVLLTVSAVLAASIFKAVKAAGSTQTASAAPQAADMPEDTSDTAESSTAALKEQEETKRKPLPEKTSIPNREPVSKHPAARRNVRKDGKMAKPYKTPQFSCFDLEPEANEPRFSRYISDSSETSTIESFRINSHTSQPGAVNPQTMRIEPEQEKSLELDIKPEIQPAETASENDIYRPELITELKIGADKGFYLTTAGDNSFALFGYAADNIFFLQRFNSLYRTNLKAKFYDRKYGKDIYIISLDNYQAAVSVSDNEIRELAPV